jgi:hypothetical protein
MTAIKSITSAIALASLPLLSSSVAAEPGAPLRALPMHDVSFDIGSKYAVGYFLMRDGNCDLTVLLTDRFSEDDKVAPGVPARFMISIAPSKTAKVGLADGTGAESLAPRAPTL